MGIFKTTTLVYPRPSPKMDEIYAALLHGWKGSSVNLPSAELYVMWGLIGNNAQIMKENSDWIFCDMPYHGRYDPNNEDWPNTYWRWCKNGLHDNRKLDVPSDRFDQWNIKVEPWKTDGDYILICPSSNAMTKYMNGYDQDTWVNKTYEYVKSRTNKPVKVRFKPRKNGTSGPSVADVSIEEELKNASALITSASLTAIDALKMGVPVFTTNYEHCPAAWCANKLGDVSLDKPHLYDREQLFYNLAYKQYSIKEMKEGVCYENSRLYLFN